ncbi:transmembrane protease serine 9-like isoform X1 [Aphidius gifuensis]|uniref:transmembrane protease serine 9-like isoform X1 n=1 Tax=Aphidius gifuensis TaxID=684658 RepID=UPI001CDD3226|nr:transmembrane protease serine 9-like isoform X1 [Aphidius gifuensis]
MKFFHVLIVINFVISISDIATAAKKNQQPSKSAECGRPAVSQRQPRLDDLEDVIQPKKLSPSKTTGRIFNGKPSRKGSWSWQVSLQLLHPKLGFIGHWCGGVLINPSWVLTAAHCIENDVFNLPIGALWTAVIGEQQLDSNVRDSIRIPVERIVIHEQFNNYINDIALMKLSRPTPLSKVIRTICLPDVNEKFETNCIISGWGRSGPSPSLSSALLEANIPLLDIGVCKQAYGNTVHLQEGHLCAGHTNGSTGSCVGDSGGPLQCRGSDGAWKLVGITSFGFGCARVGFPDVYSDVSIYSGWITDTMKFDENT